MKEQLLAIAARLEAGATGVPVWRVAGADGAYCVEYSRDDTIWPQREAEKWVEDHADYCKENGMTAQAATRYTQQDREQQKLAVELRAMAEAMVQVADGEVGATPEGLQAGLRAIVDVAWNEATESTVVPSTHWADRIIVRALAAVAMPRDVLTAAHKARREACGAWSAVMNSRDHPVPEDFEARCQKAEAAETELTVAINALAASRSPAPATKHIAWLHDVLREAGYCIDGGKCNHGCGPRCKCFRTDGCVPLSGSGLADNWKLPTEDADHTVAINVLHQQARAYESMSRPMRNTVTEHTAAENAVKAKSLRAAIVALGGQV